MVIVVTPVRLMRRMVLSCLVEPLVSPLIGRGTGGPGRTGLSRSRLAASAQITSALLVAASSMPSADELLQQEETTEVARNAHKKPDPIPYRQVLDAFIARDEKIMSFDLIAAPEFESEAILMSRLKHSRDIVRDTGPGLGLGLRIDRTRRASQETFLLFASGKHLSGSPAHT
jgi:hypothetical protein